MQVITLNQEALETATSRLAEMIVAECSGKRYDAIIGIRRGGAYVCDAFCRAFPEDLYRERHDVTLQRPGTHRKGGLTGKILRRLPVKILDLLRIAESRLLSLLHRHKGTKAPPQTDIDTELAAIITGTENPRILLIDDAIDSGQTLSAVISSLKNINPTAMVEAAVITETTDSPLVRANYTIYRNRTLIRFPWSNDFKDTQKVPHL